MNSPTLSRMQKVELLKRIANNPSIPSPPTVVLRILEEASRPECTIADLCQIIQMDAGMSSRILRIVNSATFGLSRAVSSIQRALAVVGLNSARLIVLAISFPDLQQKMCLADPARMQRYWKSSVAGAIVAGELSRRLHGKDPEDDIAAGLLRDLGELVLLKIVPEGCQTVFAQPAARLVDQQIELEEIHCGLNHADVSAFILDRWRLPTEMTEAIRHHHDPEAGVYSSQGGQDRAYLLHFATRAAQLLLHPDQPRVLAKLHELAEKRFGLGTTDVEHFLLPLSEKINEFAKLLQIDLGAMSTYEEVLSQANEELVNIILAAKRDHHRANESARQAESEARRWRQEAVFDPLTKVFNRRFLEIKLRELAERCEADAVPLGLLFIDLDGFKPVNDQFGHPFGDLVLQETAACLTRQVRQDDIVARFGGDEFCVLFESIDPEGLMALAQRIWLAINEMRVVQGAMLGRVGASIGIVHFDPTQERLHGEQLLSRADQAMYAAKAQGKNRIVCWNAPAPTVVTGAKAKTCATC